MAEAAARLAEGADDWFTAVGTSMTPAIKPVQRVRLRPVRDGEPLSGLVVLSRVGGRFWLHRATAETPDEVHVEADNGMVNGWTPRSHVYGVLVEGR